MENITLREIIKTNYKTITSFNKISRFTDLPYNFDQVNKYWWRWYSDIYGFYYHRVKRSYSIWLTTFLKKNIGIYMPFLFKMPNKRSKIIDNWRRRSFLYGKTLYNKIDNVNVNTKLDFWLVNYNKLSEAAREVILPGNRQHRQLNSFGIFGLELNMFISSYNAKWNNLYKPESLFFNTGRMPRDFLLVINSFYISSGFFINSYDSNLTLYPQYYLEYHNKLYNNEIKKIILFFQKKNNIIFFINILTLISLLYLEFISFKFKNYIKLTITNGYNFINYKLNIYLYYIRYLKFYYDKVINVNYFYLFFFYLNQFNIKKIIFIANVNNKKNNLFNFTYINYFSNNILWSDNWYLCKYLNKKSYAYDFLFKYLHKYQLNRLPYGNLYLKKLYITEWIYLWEILNENKMNFKNMKRKKQSKYFINKFIFLLKNKYTNLKDIFSILEYLKNLKNKFFKTNSTTTSLIRPSIKTIRTPLISKLTWVTFFGKHFVTIPYQSNDKDVAFFFTNSYNKLRFISYIRYTKLLLIKIKKFLIKFYTLLVNNLKINFGFSYTILTENNKMNINYNIYSYNLQYYIYIYFSFIRQYFRSKYDFCKLKNSFNLQKSNIYEKKFHKVLFFSIKNYRNKLIYKKLSRSKCLNINNFKYLKFINKF